MIAVLVGDEKWGKTARARREVVRYLKQREERG
jgi:hypothetical protein